MIGAEAPSTTLIWDGPAISRIYGKSGGSAEAISYTETILEANFEEKNSEPYMAAYICGDRNASTDKLTIVKDLIDEESCTDPGANASIWGGVNNVNTWPKPPE